jgi:hypothetical protein
VRSRDKEIKLWFQVYNLKIDEETKKPSATVETVITKNGQEVKRVVEESSQLSNAAAQMTLVRAVPVSEFEPGRYDMLVRVTDNLSKEVIASSAGFTVR